MENDPGLEGQRPLPAGTETMGRLLQGAGYETAIIGKWGLGGPLTEGIPNEQGFDFFFSYNCQRQAHTYYPAHLWRNREKVLLSNPLVAPHTGLGEGADRGAPGEEAIYAFDAEAGEAKKILESPTEATYVAPGYLAFLADGNLMLQPFNAERLELEGTPRAVASDVGYQLERWWIAADLAPEGVVSPTWRPGTPHRHSFCGWTRRGTRPRPGPRPSRST